MSEHIYPGDREELRLSSETTYIMKEAALWGKVMSVIGFVFIGIYLLFVLFMGIYSAMGMYDYMPEEGVSRPGLFIALNMIVGGIAFLPFLALYRFSFRMGKALAAGDTKVLNKSFESLKNYFVINVVLALIGLVLGFVVLFATILTLAWF